MQKMMMISMLLHPWLLLPCLPLPRSILIGDNLSCRKALSFISFIPPLRSTLAMVLSILQLHWIWILFSSNFWGLYKLLVLIANLDSFALQPTTGRSCNKIFDGPFKVLKCINDYAYKIELPWDYGVSTTFNVIDILPYYEDKKPRRPRLSGKSSSTRGIWCQSALRTWRLHGLPVLAAWVTGPNHIGSRSYAHESWCMMIHDWFLIRYFPIVEKYDVSS